MHASDLGAGRPQGRDDGGSNADGGRHRHSRGGAAPRTLPTGQPATPAAGCDHVASAVNTLVLAYAGAALPLLFTLSGRGLGEVLTT